MPSDQLDKVVQLLNLSFEFASAAQEVLDNHDWKTGSAGVAVADALAEVLEAHGFEFRNGEYSGDHPWWVVKMPEGYYAVDLPASRYETPDGNAWLPVEDIEITADDIHVWPM